MKGKLRFLWRIIYRSALGFVAFVALWICGAHFLPYSLQQSWCSSLGNFRTWLIENYPSLYEKQKSFYDGEHSWFFPSHSTSKRQAIILVHGLDEPGPIWDGLIPVLNAQDFATYSFIYPNDLGIHASSEFLFSRLIDLRKEGVEEIIIVGHSMGGLVTRNAITHPQFDFITMMEEGQIPLCHQVITVGTPNHGSQFAKGRFFAEFRDQWAHITQGKHGFFGGIFDGTGQAGLDLYPDSAFLRELNAREYPKDKIPMTIIAAILINSDSPKASLFQEGIQQKQNSTELLSLSEKIGDGLVSIKSATLPSIEAIYIVPANHHDILHNMSYQRNRTPPAIPIILEIVSQKFSKSETVLSENSVEKLP